MQEAVCILIVNKTTNMFLSVSLKDDHTDMNLPGGKVEENETLLEAAMRETKEETGLDIYNLSFVYEEIDGNYNVSTFYTKDFSGKIFTKENHIIKWLPLIDLTKSKKWPNYNTIIYNLYNEKFKN